MRRRRALGLHVTTPHLPASFKLRHSVSQEYAARFGSAWSEPLGTCIRSQFPVENRPTSSPLIADLEKCCTFLASQDSSAHLPRTWSEMQRNKSAAEVPAAERSPNSKYCSRTQRPALAKNARSITDPRERASTGKRRRALQQSAIPYFPNLTERQAADYVGALDSDAVP